MRVQGRAVLLAALTVSLARPLAANDPPPQDPDRDGLRRLLEDLAYEPRRGDRCPRAGAPARGGGGAPREARWRVALHLRGAIAAMTSQHRLDYLAGRRAAPEVVDLWVWLPEPDAPPPDAPPPDPPPPSPPTVEASLPREVATPTLPGGARPHDAKEDGLSPDRWAPDPEAPYRPVRIVPQVARGPDGHTRSVWLRDPAAQARRFLERQARNAALGGREWLRDEGDERRAPLPPLRDASGHTRSRYAGRAPTHEEEDAILRGWGARTLEDLERDEARPAPRAPRPLPSVCETLRWALRGRRD